MIVTAIIGLIVGVITGLFLGSMFNGGRGHLHQRGWPHEQPPFVPTEVDGVWQLIEYYEGGRPVPGIVADNYVVYRQCGLQIITVGGVPYSVYYYFVEPGVMRFRGPDGNHDDPFGIDGDRMWLGPSNSPEAVYQRVR